MKKITLLFVFLNLVSFLYSAGKNDMPDWVKQKPDIDPAYAVYFVGKSERGANYENYLEAKAGALMDVLTQFSIYKGVKVDSMTTNYSEAILSGDYEHITRLISNTNSAGLHQMEEWMADDGTLYILCYFCLYNNDNPFIHDFPVSFNDVQWENDRTYFVAKAVSPYNTGELSFQSEQSAKMRILLWLGVDIKGLFNHYCEVTEKAGNTEELESIRAVLKCTSKIDLQSLSFREEFRHIQKEQDKKYHYYGLYSIKDIKPENTAEYDCFTYSTEYKNDNSTMTFAKQVNFNRSVFTRDKPYTTRQSSNTPANIPQKIRDLPEEDYSCIFGTGMAKNASVEVGNIIATMGAIEQVAVWMGSETQNLLREYSSETGNVADNKYTEYITRMSISQSLSSQSLSQCIKIYDELSGDGTLWQAWRYPKDYVERSLDANGIPAPESGSFVPLKVPDFSSLDAQRRMDEAFRRMDSKLSDTKSQE